VVGTPFSRTSDLPLQHVLSALTRLYEVRLHDTCLPYLLERARVHILAAQERGLRCLVTIQRMYATRVSEDVTAADEEEEKSMERC
jgi:hypothetical protein